MNDNTAVKTSIFRICEFVFLLSIVLAAVQSGALAQMLPEASKGFVPKMTYAIDYDPAWAKVNAALAANSITVVSAAKGTGQIETDFLEGSKSTSHGTSLESHYKFTIQITHGQQKGQTTIGVVPLLEARAVKGNKPADYRDVTKENAALAAKVRDWLYEKIETGFPPSALTLAAAAPPPAAAPTDDNAASKQPKKGGFMNSLGGMLNKSLKTALGGQMIGGYFDFGPGPNPQRYYCMIDPKTGEKQDPAVIGEQVQYTNGMSGVRVSSVSMLSCAGMEKQGKLVTVGYGSTAKAADRVGLRNVLPEYDEDQPVKNQWPHVAITIVHSPPDWAKENLVGEDLSYLGCWTLKAMVWTSATQSHAIEPFQYCIPQDNGTEVKFGLGASWPTRSEADIGYLTGVKRTEGPAPPNNILPGDRETSSLAAAHHGARWNGFLADRNYYSSPIGVLLGTLRFQMGARDVENSHDLRMWIVSISQ